MEERLLYTNFLYAFYGKTMGEKPILETKYFCNIVFPFTTQTLASVNLLGFSSRLWKVKGCFSVCVYNITREMRSLISHSPQGSDNIRFSFVFNLRKSKFIETPFRITPVQHKNKNEIALSTQTILKPILISYYLSNLLPNSILINLPN